MGQTIENKLRNMNCFGISLFCDCFTVVLYGETVKTGRKFQNSRKIHQNSANFFEKAVKEGKNLSLDGKITYLLRKMSYSAYFKAHSASLQNE